MDSVTFSKDVAIVAAQVAAVLVVAFVVEVRALGERRGVSGLDAKWLVIYVFFILTVILATTAIVANGPERVIGWPALGAWTVVSAGTLVLVLLVGMAAWAGTTVASDDGAEHRARMRRVDRFLDRPGWRWWIRGATGRNGSSSDIDRPPARRDEDENGRGRSK